MMTVDKRINIIIITLKLTKERSRSVEYVPKCVHVRSPTLRMLRQWSYFGDEVVGIQLGYVLHRSWYHSTDPIYFSLACDYNII